MKPCNIAAKVIEAVARDVSCGVKVDAVEALHDVGVVGNIEVGHYRLAVLRDLDVFAVVLADGHGGVDDIRYNHHYLGYLLGVFGFETLALGKSLGEFRYLGFGCHGLVLLALSHQSAYLLGDLVSVCSEGVRLLLDRS